MFKINSISFTVSLLISCVSGGYLHAAASPEPSTPMKVATTLDANDENSKILSNHGVTGDGATLFFEGIKEAIGAKDLSELTKADAEKIIATLTEKAKKVRAFRERTNLLRGWYASLHEKLFTEYRKMTDHYASGAFDASPINQKLRAATAEEKPVLLAERSAIWKSEREFHKKVVDFHDNVLNAIGAAHDRLAH